MRIAEKSLPSKQDGHCGGTQHDLRGFADRIGRSTAEDLLFTEAGQILLARAAVGDLAQFHRFLRASAYTDAALLLYRAVLPDWGFQLGLSPPSRDRQAVPLASSWRAGDRSATPCQATTPALALLRAAATNRASEIEACILAECPQCRGLGWYVTAENRKQICRHRAAKCFGEQRSEADE